MIDIWQTHRVVTLENVNQIENYWMIYLTSRKVPVMHLKVLLQGLFATWIWCHQKQIGHYIAQMSYWSIDHNILIRQVSHCHTCNKKRQKTKFWIN